MSTDKIQPDSQKIEIPKFDPNRDPEEYDFGPSFINLFVHENFLGAISANIVRCEDWTVPTAYIGVDTKNLTFIMGYNPEFMARLSKRQREWVIKHEIYHLCLQHILGRANADRKMRQISNIAADLAVNSLLGPEHMYEFALMPGQFPKNCQDQQAGELIQAFPVLESMEFYLESLKKFAKSRQKDECPVCAAQKKKKQQKKGNNGNNPDQNQGKKDPGKDGKDGQPGENGQNGEEGQNGQGGNSENSDKSDKSDKHDHGDGNGSGEGGQGGGQGQGQGSSGGEGTEDGEGHGHGGGQLCDEHGGEGDGDSEYTIGIGGPDGETMDSHKQWDQVPEDIRDILNEKIKDMVSEGVKRAQMKGSWGSVPTSMQEIIQKMLTSEIDWKSILRHFIGRARSMDRDSTIKRLNKKAPYIFPGVRRKTKAKLCFFIDQSGSMSNEDVQLAMAAAFECSKESEIDVYNFDTSVDESSFQTWKRGSTVEWHRTRGGGTDFNGVRDFVSQPKNKGRWQGIAIVTDGYAPEMGQLIGVKVIWLITPGGTLEYVRSGDLVVKMKEEKTAHIKK